jgi:hypothetical protein
MPLRDVTGVVFDRGNGPFNESAAREAYHLVMKMDPESANEFVHHVVNEVVETVIEENRELVQKHLDRTIAKCLVYADLDAVAAGLNLEERQEFKKALLATVSKAEFDPDEHLRDDHGRFIVMTTHQLSRKDAEKMGINIPPHPDHDELVRSNPAALNRYRSQYAQVVNHLNLHDGFAGHNNVTLHYTSGDPQEVKVHKNPATLAAAIRPEEGVDVKAVEITPYKPVMGGKVVNLTQALGGGAAAGMKTIGSKETDMSGYSDPYAEGGESPFVRQWNSGHPSNSTQQMYNRIGAGSKLITDTGLGAANPLARTAAKFGSYVGQYGSSAESVFGPPVRRMAYRYRGTERRPPADLVEEYGTAVHNAKQTLGAQPNRRYGESVQDWEKRAMLTHAERVPTWQERGAGRVAIARWLEKQAPDKQYTALHLQAGHTPPSEGVLLNADGQIVTTAVGAADDWYLPFNLKHLSQLKGGEYIRTRSSGGLTPEDVYTGLMTGARRVSVVSRSGVFSIDFDDELRGGRRHNDKALRMTKRYAELLDAVQSGQVQRADLDPKQMNEIRAEVRSKHPGISGKEFQERVNAAKKERMENPTHIDLEIEHLKFDRAQTEKTRALGKDELTAYNERLFDLNKQKEYNWRLNGIGYGAAAKALQEQFPYYIKASYTARFGHDTPISEKDMGYVEPGALRPTAARANLFGGAVGPNGVRVKAQWDEKHKGGISARTADHAKPIVDRYPDKKGRSGDMAPESSESSESASSSGWSGSSGASAEEKQAAWLRKQEAIEEATKVRAALPALVGIKQDGGIDIPQFVAAQRYAAMSKPGEFEEVISRPGELEKFQDAVQQVQDRYSIDPRSKDTKVPNFEEFKSKMGGKKGGEYKHEKAVRNPEGIFSFPGISPIERDQAMSAPMASNGRAAGDADATERLNEAKMWVEADKIANDSSIESGDKAAYLRLKLEHLGIEPADEDFYRDAMDEGIRKRALRNIQLVRAEKDKPLVAIGSGKAAKQPFVKPADEYRGAGPRTKLDLT